MWVILSKDTYDCAESPTFDRLKKLKHSLEKVKISVNKKFKEWYTIIIRVTLQASRQVFDPSNFLVVMI